MVPGHVTVTTESSSPLSARVLWEVPSEQQPEAGCSLVRCGRKRRSTRWDSESVASDLRAAATKTATNVYVWC